MCPFKHEVESNDISQERQEESVDMDVNESNSLEYIEARKKYCARYCNEKWYLHIYDSKKYKPFRGIDIYKYEDVFRCNLCENTSSGSTNHIEHFDEEHANVDKSISCII